MFKERLRLCRENKGLSQTHMAELLKMTRQAYNHYETGNRVPTQDTLIEIANFFNVSVDYLLGRSDEPNSLTLDEQLEGIDFALWGEVKEMTDAQKRDVINFAKFVKSQEKK